MCIFTNELENGGDRGAEDVGYKYKFWFSVTSQQFQAKPKAFKQEKD